MTATTFADFANRPIPDWFHTTRFGIFVHWGAYSVPAWAEPIGALGTIPGDYWMLHNPYAEWYFNTIRLEGSPAAQHHAEVHHGRPYDEFLDEWRAERFDPAALCDLFVRAGAGYLVPTTKHHDGITLWDAPGTGDRNTVRRGPKRDLIGAFAAAARAAGMRFGTYYSGGLDWHVRPGPPVGAPDVGPDMGRPLDREYGVYCAEHCEDLITRYAPDILWNDIQWPDEAKDFEPGGLGELFNHYYAAVPEGLVNDRYGDTHHDYATSEYEAGLENETDAEWENCRGIGFSFGYNQVEDESVSLDGPAIARHLTDIVSRGGHFLLNVGPKADGTLPDVQVRALEGLATWMDAGGRVVTSAGPSSRTVTAPEGVWARVVHAQDGQDWLFVDEAEGSVEVSVDGSPVTVDVAAERPGPVPVAL